MPLVEPRGIYCFYARPLLRALAGRIGRRSCLEVAAGDGTLSRFLARAGVSIRATDDRSWSHAIAYPAEVERLDAAEAVRRYRPQVVLCSWPPPDNRFEADVLAGDSVELYVLIASRHRFASGDWDAYARQQRFRPEVDEALSRWVLPPEIDPVVVLFQRA
jgi:hypothetical protein